MDCPKCGRAYGEGVAYCAVDGEMLVSPGSDRAAFATTARHSDALAPVSGDRYPAGASGSLGAIDPILGTTLDGRYYVHSKLGEGGMGVVYRAQQVAIGRDVAIKLLSREASSEQRLVKRFETEAKIISQLRHPNTLKLIDFGRAPDGRLYIVTEFLEGTTLDARMTRRPLGVGELVSILLQVCDSLSEAHAQGIVHRDLKPANIFLEQVDDQVVVKVLDFGIAKLAQGASHTATGSIFGTPCYMSPEQAQGLPVDGRTDIYSVGVIAYECVAGGPPFFGDNAMAILLQHVNKQPPPVHQVCPETAAPIDLQRLVLRMLCKDPDGRPTDIRALQRELRGLGDDDSASSRRPHSYSAPAAGGDRTDEMSQPSAAAFSTGVSLPPAQRSQRVVGAGLFLLSIALVVWLVLPLLRAQPAVEDASPKRMTGAAIGAAGDPAAPAPATVVLPTPAAKTDTPPAAPSKPKARPRRHAPAIDSASARRAERPAEPAPTTPKAGPPPVKARPPPKARSTEAEEFAKRMGLKLVPIESK